MSSEEENDKFYRSLLAPTTFMILISYQLYSKLNEVVRDPEYLEILVRTGFQPMAQDLALPFFSASFSLTVLSLSIFSYILGSTYRKSFLKRAALYFLLTTFSWYALLNLLDAFILIPVEYCGILASLFTIYLPVPLAFAQILGIGNFRKFYALVFAFDVAAVWAIDSLPLSGIFPPTVLAILQVVFAWYSSRPPPTATH